MVSRSALARTAAGVALWVALLVATAVVVVGGLFGVHFGPARSGGVVAACAVLAAVALVALAATVARP